MFSGGREREIGNKWVKKLVMKCKNDHPDDSERD